jgi:hypothetical protein
MSGAHPTVPPPSCTRSCTRNTGIAQRAARSVPTGCNAEHAGALLLFTRCGWKWKRRRPWRMTAPYVFKPALMTNIDQRRVRGAPCNSTHLESRTPRTPKTLDPVASTQARMAGPPLLGRVVAWHPPGCRLIPSLLHLEGAAAHARQQGRGRAARELRLRWLQRVVRASTVHLRHKYLDASSNHS